MNWFADLFAKQPLDYSAKPGKYSTAPDSLMQPDLYTIRQKLRSGQTQPGTEIERSIEVAQSARCQQVFLQTLFDEARATASGADLQTSPLAGLAVSIKDLFDVAGQITRAGSVLFNEAAPATCDSPAVARLRRAGAAFIGRTNMVEFAFSGVGINPHFGTPANAATSDFCLLYTSDAADE